MEKKLEVTIKKIDNMTTNAWLSYYEDEELQDSDFWVFSDIKEVKAYAKAYAKENGVKIKDIEFNRVY